jgi:hypothetical protein
MNVLRILLAACLFGSLGWTQVASQNTAPNQPSSTAAAAQPKTLQELVEKQFGPDFEVVTQSPMASIPGSNLADVTQKPWQALLTGDLDGDGIQDAVIIGRNKNPMIGATAYGYKVYDAYDTYYGYGDPNVTMDINNGDPIHNLLLLVIHGKGKEAWHAEQPKAKYVIINVPFEAVSLSRSSLKKKTLDAIRVEESDTVSSLLFFDGKRYRYIPGGGSTNW